MNKEHVTKGPVYEYRGEIREDDPVSGRTLATVSDRLRDDEIEPNAELIAEAFNVLHETGMTPRELAERVHEYREQLAAVRMTLYADLDRCSGNVQHYYTNHMKHREDLDRDPKTGKLFPLSKYQPVTAA